jgi:hypothetical protein
MNIKNIKKYTIGFRAEDLYYDLLQFNNIDTFVLFLGLTLLRAHSENYPFTFEEYKRELFKVNGYLLAEDLGQIQYSTQTEIDSERFDIVILSQYTAEDDNIPYLLAAFPEYTKKELKQHEYRMSVDNYLDILEKLLNFHAAKVPYIILYEDEHKIVHCEEYDPTEEEKSSNWKAIPNNQAK